VSRKLALLVGNGRYEASLPPLGKPDADIAALARVLADPAIGGFDEVTPLLDCASAQVRREIARFFAARGHDDLLLLYFSGHGLRSDRGALYLAARDTEPDLLRGTAIPADYIAEEMDNCRSRRQILILDCCYSGAFAGGAKGAAASPVKAFEGNGIGRVVLTASGANELAWEEGSEGRRGRPPFSPDTLSRDWRAARRTSTATGWSRWTSSTTMSTRASSTRTRGRLLGSRPTGSRAALSWRGIPPAPGVRRSCRPTCGRPWKATWLRYGKGRFASWRGTFVAAMPDCPRRLAGRPSRRKTTTAGG
jgi:hypothetical protein